MDPRVSVCLTTWNRATTVSKTLDSLLAQTYSDFEVIISDDCSTDGTDQVCQDYVRRDARVRYYRNAQRLNMPGTLNAAIARARGGYIANVHDGDVYHPELLARWKEALDAVPGAPFVFNAYSALDRHGILREYRFPSRDSKVPGQDIARHYFRTATSCVWGTVMARASAYAAHGPFDARFGFISDVDMWLTLSRGSEVAYVNDALIALGPRPEDHPFRHGLWRAAFWTFEIYVKCLQMYRGVLDAAELSRYWRDYPAMVRRYFLRTMASCVRRRRWSRIREGLAMWRDADDSVLRWIGAVGRAGWAPPWYDRNAWARIARPDA